MALFEKKYTNKVLLDDTEELTSVIENARTIDGHTVILPVTLFYYCFTPHPLLFLSLGHNIIIIILTYICSDESREYFYLWKNFKNCQQTEELFFKDFGK